MLGEGRLLSWTASLLHFSVFASCSTARLRRRRVCLGCHPDGIGVLLGRLVMGLLLGLLVLVLAVGEPFALASSSTQPIARVTTLLGAASPGASCNRSGLDHLSHTRLAAGHGCLVGRGVAQRASLTAHGLDCFYCERHGLGFRLVILSFLPLHRVLLAIRALVRQVQPSGRVPPP